MTGLAVEGSPEFVAATLVKLAGLSVEEAAGTVGVSQAQGLTESDPAVVRLCRKCADRNGGRVAPLGGDDLPLYSERQMFGPGGFGS